MYKVSEYITDAESGATDRAVIHCETEAEYKMLLLAAKVLSGSITKEGTRLLLETGMFNDLTCISLIQYSLKELGEYNDCW